MLLKELIPTEEMARMTEDSVILVTENKEKGISVINYSKFSAYDEENWTKYPFLRLCRGIIVNNKTNEVIARPFPKFFNLNEPAGLHLDELSMNTKIDAWNKADGVLAISYILDGKLYFSSRGSSKSEFADAMNVFASTHPEMKNYMPPEGMTILAEFVGPNSHIIVNYPREDLILLGGIMIETGEFVPPEDIEWPLSKVEKTEYTTLKDAVLHWNDYKAQGQDLTEGMVITLLDGEHAGEKVKLKQEDYILLARMAVELSPKSIFTMMYSHDKRGVLPESVINEFISRTPDEFYPEIERVRNAISSWVEKDVDTKIALYKEALQYLIDSGDDFSDRGKSYHAILDKYHSSEVAKYALQMKNDDMEKVYKVVRDKSYKELYRNHLKEIN